MSDDDDDDGGGWLVGWLVGGWVVGIKLLCHSLFPLAPAQILPTFFFLSFSPWVHYAIFYFFAFSQLGQPLPEIS